MRECMKEVANLLMAKTPCIWIDTYEEAEVLKDVREIIATEPSLSRMGIKMWSHTEGLTDVPKSRMEKTKDPDASYAQIAKLLSAIGTAQRSNDQIGQESIWILRDLHLLNDNHAVKRQIRDLKEYPSMAKNYNPIIVVAPIVNIPIEHEKLFTIIHYDVPSLTDVQNFISKLVDHLRAKNEKKHVYIIPTKEEQNKLVRASLGLTAMELQQVFMRSLVEYKTLSVEAITKEKIQMVEKSGVLDYTIPKASFDDVGGNQAFKDWFFNEVADSFSDEAREFGVPASKGYLSLGIPGTSKTLAAEAVANHFGVPLLSLNMAKIMGSLVGQSEKKIDQAFRVAKAVAPCVFLIDEIEKALGGIRSSNSSDAGTTSRVFGAVLRFLNEDDNGIFVVATSNDVSQLPAELTRAGRLDTKWYFGIPNEEERKEIFKIHFNKLNRPLSDELLDFAVDHAKNYTGAEIREVARATMRVAYTRFRKDGNREIAESDIGRAIEGVIPLYRSAQASIMALERYADGRARFASASVAQNTSNFNESLDEDLMNDLKSIM